MKIQRFGYRFKLYLEEHKRLNPTQSRSCDMVAAEGCTKMNPLNIVATQQDSYSKLAIVENIIDQNYSKKSKIFKLTLSNSISFEINR